MKMLIKSNKGNNCIPPLRNSINDENFDDIVYGDEDKCDLLNEYLGIQLFPLFDLISIFIIFQYVFGLDEFSKRI
jgi:hypothetical protein